MYGSASARMCAFSPASFDPRREVARPSRHDVRRFSSMYACDRSVVSTVASPCASRRSQRISMSCSASARGDRGFVVRARDAVAAHGDAVVRDVDRLGIEVRAARAELGEDAAPVGVVAVERALHELAVGDGPGRDPRLGRDCARRRRATRTNFVAPSASRAICSASDPHTSVSASVSACAIDRAGPAVGEHEHGVVRRTAAVDREAVEGLADRVRERPLQRGRVGRGVGRDDREHRRHRGRQHRRALGHPADRRAHRRGRPPPSSSCRWSSSPAPRGPPPSARELAAQLRDARPRARPSASGCR